jgi:hypothetical protein
VKPPASAVFAVDRTALIRAPELGAVRQGVRVESVPERKPVGPFEELVRALNAIA